MGLSTTLLLLPFLIITPPHSVYANFYKDVIYSWGSEHVNIFNNGRDMTLTLTKDLGGAGVQSRSTFLYGEFDMFMKLVPVGSSGTITTFYLYSTLSPDSRHDEIDIEFVGQPPGQPYKLSTNIFTRGQGGREQQFHLWFDPTADFHNYTILWNPRQILFMIDRRPVRVFANQEKNGVPYLNVQPMRMYASLWTGEWAGQVDWSNQPFVASYRNLGMFGCKWIDKRSFVHCSSASNTSNHWWNAPTFRTLSKYKRRQMNWLRKQYLIYDYCNRNNPPAECTLPN